MEREKHMKHLRYDEKVWNVCNWNPRKTREWELERNNISKDNGCELSKIEERYIQEFLSTPLSINIEKINIYTHHDKIAEKQG